MDWFLYDNGLHHERVTKKNNKNKKYTYDKLSVMRLITNKKNPINCTLQYGHVVRKDCFGVLVASQFRYAILYPNLMTVQRKNTKN